MLRNNGMTQLYTGKSAGKRTVPMPAHACIEQAEANGLKVKYVESIDEVVGGASNASKWVNEAGEICWPPNYGFKDSPCSQVLSPGTRIDRYGTEAGRFASPEGTPFEVRSLPAESANSPYSVYEVVSPVDVQAGEIAPWFGQPGGGVQYMFHSSFTELLEQGAIRKVSW